MSALADQIAEVLRGHRCNQMNGTCSCGHRYTDVATIADDHAAHVTGQVAELFTEEWAVQDEGGHVLGKWHKNAASAKKHCATIVRNFWVTHKNVAGACMVEPHPTPVRRFVSPWTAEETKP
jgi:hypothetical protein